MREPLSRQRNGRPEASTPLRGRIGELEVIRGYVDALAGGQGGQIVIRAGAGLGKTSLLTRAEQMARQAGLSVFQGRAEISDHTTPLAPILDALASGDDPGIDLGALRQLSGSPDQRFWLLRELEEQLQRAALRNPVAVLLDDIQWADPATLKAVATLAKRLVHEPILWLVATRSTDVSQVAHSTVQQMLTEGARLVELRPLDADAMGLIAQDHLGKPPAPSLMAVLARAGGIRSWS